MDLESNKATQSTKTDENSQEAVGIELRVNKNKM